MPIVSMSSEDQDRTVKSIHWVEQYRERIEAEFGDSRRPVLPPQRTNQPVRGILLQDVYEGKDGLMQLIGRNGFDTSFFLQVVGQNTAITENKFRLHLAGVSIAEDGTETTTDIGDSTPISCVAQPDEVATAITACATDSLTPDSLSVQLGNPLYDTDLIIYGDVIEQTPDTPPASLLGVWWINISLRPFVRFDYLTLTVFNDETATLTSLTQVICQSVPDLLSPETTVVTDVHNRTKAFPWQAGTIAVCLDFADVGYGIVSATSRNMEIV